MELTVNDLLEYVHFSEILGELQRLDRVHFHEFIQDNGYDKEKILVRIKELKQLRYDNQSERESVGFGKTGPF